MLVRRHLHIHQLLYNTARAVLVETHAFGAGGEVQVHAFPIQLAHLSEPHITATFQT